VGALVTGDVSEANVLNDNQGRFFTAYDNRMRDLGLTARDVWAPGAQINLKPCYFGTYGREFIDQLASRVPDDVTIKAYTEPFVWSNFTQYPFGIRTGTTHLLGDQANGLIEVRGRLPRNEEALPTETSGCARSAFARAERHDGVGRRRGPGDAGGRFGLTSAIVAIASAMRYPSAPVSMSAEGGSA